MTIEELKALLSGDFDMCDPEGYLTVQGDALKALAPEILALVEAVNRCAYVGNDGKTFEIESDPYDDACQALDAFNAKLESL